MQFNDTTNELGLIQDCENRLGLDKTTISGDSDLLNDFTRLINTWYRKTDSWIWESDIHWEFDDANYSTLPRATATLEDDQHDYELPSTARKIIKVQIKDSDGEYYTLRLIRKTDYHAPLEEVFDTKGLPKYYDLEGDSIFLYPAPDPSDVTLSEGLRLHFSRDISEFSSSDTTKEPGFDNHFHPILSIGASLDYALGFKTQDVTRISRLEKQLQEYKEELQTFYGKRAQEDKTRFERNISRRNFI